jgi:hypothetical protein
VDLRINKIQLLRKTTIVKRLESKVSVFAPHAIPLKNCVLRNTALFWLRDTDNSPQGPASVL